MPLPNFIVIGAAKAGTTALFRLMGQHPEIFCCKPKEPNFFALMGEREDFLEPDGRRRPVSELGVTDLESYRDLFSGVTTERAIGEASVDYLPDPVAAARISQLIPHARLIAILRNPVDAAFSGYLMTRGHGVEPCATFEEALADQPRREAGRFFDGLYIRPGFYFKHLGRYRAQFPAEQLKIWLYEDFLERPVELLAEIFAFLGVDNTFTPVVGEPTNVSGTPASMLLHRLLTGRTNPLGRTILPYMPDWTRRLFLSVRNRNLRRPTMAEQTRHQLIDVFREDIENLQASLRRDLSHWLN